jgi:hypothetical protein
VHLYLIFLEKIFKKGRMLLNLFLKESLSYDKKDCGFVLINCYFLLY